MNGQKRKRQQIDTNDYDDSNHSFAEETGEGSSRSTMDTVGGNTIANNIADNNVEEMRVKMTNLESENTVIKAVNKMLESKLQIQELKEQNRALLAENEVLKRNSADETDIMVENNEMAKNMGQLEVDFTNKLAILEERQKNHFELQLAIVEEQHKNHLVTISNEFSKKLAHLAEKHAEEMAELKAENHEEKRTFMGMLKETEQQGEEEKNELENRIQAIQQKLDELANKLMVHIQKKKQKEQEQRQEIGNFNWDQSKPELLWAHLIKARRLVKLEANRWDESKCSTNNATISTDGLQATKSSRKEWTCICAEHGFHLPGLNYRMDNFPGTIVHYFEITQMSTSKAVFYVGLSDGSVDDGSWVGDSPNAFVIPSAGTGDKNDCCYLSNKKHTFEWPKGVPKPPKRKGGPGDVIGCGILVLPNQIENKRAIFFTQNGIAMGKPIQISPSAVDRLLPTVSMRRDVCRPILVPIWPRSHSNTTLTSARDGLANKTPNLKTFTNIIF